MAGGIGAHNAGKRSCCLPERSESEAAGQTVMPTFTVKGLSLPLAVRKENTLLLPWVPLQPCGGQRPIEPPRREPEVQTLLDRAPPPPPPSSRTSLIGNWSNYSAPR